MINQTPHSTCNKPWHVPGYIQYLTDNVGVIGNKPQQCNETCEILLKVDYGRWATCQLITYGYTDICKSTWISILMTLLTEGIGALSFHKLIQVGKNELPWLRPKALSWNRWWSCQTLAETASAYASPLFWLRPWPSNYKSKAMSNNKTIWWQYNPTYALYIIECVHCFILLI